MAKQERPPTPGTLTVTEKLTPFVVHGVDFREQAGNQQIADCPFCGKDKFFVNEDTAQWDCKHCGKNGNVWDFLKETVALHRAATTKDQYTTFSVDRGLPRSALKAWGLAFNGENWLMPVINDKGTTVNLYIYKTVKAGGEYKHRWIPTTSLGQTIGGLDALAKAKPGMRVWICEGQSDAMAMQWMLRKSGHTNDIVVWVPGAGIFKNAWVRFFHKHNVILCYDNDGSGDNGALKAARALQGVAASIGFLCWPEARPLSWDIRDTVKTSREEGVSPEAILEALLALVKPDHRHSINATAKPDPVKPDRDSTVSFDETLDVFGKYLKLDQDFRDCAAIVFATCLANQFRGDPVWIYIVGPSGSGKTQLLMSLEGTPKTHFESSFTPKSLVSGYTAGGSDPSLIPKLDGKTAVFKDGTELLTMAKEQRSEIYGVLRGAYDGRVERSFGNIRREYKSQFNVLMGITPSIHGESQALWGDRFLKIEMRNNYGDKERETVGACISNINKETTMAEEFNAVVKEFLLRDCRTDSFPTLDGVYLDKIITLAQFTATLRAAVDRDPYGDHNVKYRPVREVANRIGKQLAKLAMTLCRVLDKKEIDAEVYRIVRKVGMDTCIGFHLDIVRAFMKRSNIPQTKNDISHFIGIPYATVGARIEDLVQMGILEAMMKIDLNDRNEQNRFRVEPNVALMYRTTKAFDSVTYSDKKAQIAAKKAAFEGNGQFSEKKMVPSRSRFRLQDVPEGTNGEH